MQKFFVIVVLPLITLLVGGCGTSGVQYQTWSSGSRKSYPSSQPTGVSFFNGTTVSQYGSPPTTGGPRVLGDYVTHKRGDGAIGVQANGTSGGKRYDEYYRRQDQLLHSGGYSTQSTTTRSWGTPGNRAYSSGTVTESVTYFPPSEDRSFGRAVQSLNSIGEALFGKPNSD